VKPNSCGQNKEAYVWNAPFKKIKVATTTPTVQKRNKVPRHDKILHRLVADTSGMNTVTSEIRLLKKEMTSHAN